MLLSEAFEKYRQDVILDENQSPKTEESHRYAQKFLIECIGDIPIEAVTMEHIRQWRRWLRNDRGVRTIREYLVRLRMVLRHMRREGYDVLYYRHIMLPKYKGNDNPRFLTKQQICTIIDELNTPVRGYPKICRLRNLAIVSLLASAGLRASELRQLDRWEVTRADYFAVAGKSAHTRPCFIDERARKHLDAYLALRTDNNPALFISHQTGKRLSKSGLQIIFARINRLVDFGFWVHAHTLRHSFATGLLMDDVDIRHIQAMMGHTSVQTTQIYTHVLDPDLHNIYRSKHTI